MPKPTNAQLQAKNTATLSLHQEAKAQWNKERLSYQRKIGLLESENAVLKRENAWLRDEPPLMMNMPLFPGFFAKMGSKMGRLING
jgi:hypothetical protein